MNSSMNREILEHQKINDSRKLPNHAQRARSKPFIQDYTQDHYLGRKTSKFCQLGFNSESKSIQLDQPDVSFQLPVASGGSKLE